MFEFALIPCPRCKEKCRVAQAQAGMQGTCAFCGGNLTVPEAAFAPDLAQAAAFCLIVDLQGILLPGTDGEACARLLPVLRCALRESEDRVRAGIASAS
jgi:hypothetical protein